jgi:membrane fusion protein (multidrug efflux system)
MSVYASVDTSEGASGAESDADLDAPTLIHPQ